MQKFQRISTNEAKQKLVDNSAILIDIRDQESFNEGHADAALHITQENITAFIENTQKDTPVMVVCYHGNSSQNIAQFLSMQGFSDVYSVDGGYEEWKNNF